MANLILLSGLPGSGKSSFGEFLGKELMFPLVAKDEIKEYLFDHIGFANHAEKTQLDIVSVEIMHYTARKILQTSSSVILDNNYENRNIPSLHRLLDDCPCNVITVFFYGEPAVIYERFLKRDRGADRHPGHGANTRYPNPPKSEEVVDLETYIAKFRERGTMDFSVGSLIRVDATDFAKVSYEDILQEIRQLLH